MAGCCPRHVAITTDKVKEAKAAHPNALFAAHPECTKDVLVQADYIGSTSGIIDYVVNTNHDEFIIGTVDGVFAEIKKQAPGKKLYTVKDQQVCSQYEKGDFGKGFRCFGT